MPADNITNVYDLMPPLKRSFIFTALIDKVENIADSKAIAAWVVILFTGLAAAFGFLVTVYSAIQSGGISRFLLAHPNIELALSGSGVTLLLGLAIIWWMRRREAQLLISADTASDFKILQMVSLAYITSTHRVQYAHRYWVEARSDDARYFDMKFGWSSSPPTLSIVMRNKKFNFEVEDRKPFGQQRIIIDLGAPLGKSCTEVIEFCFHTNTEGYPAADPVNSVTMASRKFPRFNTFLAVAVADGIDIVALYRERYFSFLADRPIRRDAVRLSGSRTHVWPIPVKPGWRSCLHWNFGE